MTQEERQKDEKIRKALVKLFQDCGNTDIEFCNTGFSYQEIFAWLEKQGDKDKLIKELGEYKVKYTQEVLEKHINSMSNKDDERLRKTTMAFLKDFAEQGYENAVECIDWLEKQGETSTILSNSSNIGNVTLSEEEQNRFAKCVLTSCASSFIDYLDAHKYEGKMCVSNGECEDIENAFHNAMWDRLHRYYCKYIEKQGEQKPNPYSGTSFEYNGHIWGMCARDNGVDILCDKHIIEHFET